MGIITVNQSDCLFWLGRYIERVYTTLRMYCQEYDRMIDEMDDSHEEYCRRMGIPNVYASREDFRNRYPFDPADPCSICSTLNRAYDNAILLRGDLGRQDPLDYGKVLEQGRIIMEKVHDTMVYAKGRTGMDTTAEQALEQGSGVCQDESHVMIALCRLSGLTARYAAGFLYGEGESHAWVEVLHNGRWYGLDPTNAIPAGEKHIRIAVGRDVRDCPMNSGIFYGSADQEIRVKVKVWEKEMKQKGV